MPPPPMQTQAAVQAAAQVMATAQAGGRDRDEKVSEPFVSRSGGDVSGPVGSNLFVYHIPNTWDDSILRQHFEHFGSIVSCRIQKDGEGRPRGFGFVSFDAPAAAQAAIAG